MNRILSEIIYSVLVIESRPRRTRQRSGVKIRHSPRQGITPSFAPLVLRSAAPKARHMIAWGASPRLTRLVGVRSEGSRDSVVKAAQIPGRISCGPSDRKRLF